MADPVILPPQAPTRNPLAELGEYLRRSGRNLADLPGGVADWLAGGARLGAEPTVALMRGDALDQPFWPTADSGGRIGAIASAVTAPLVPGSAPAGALGIYGGRLAKTANLDKLAEAEKMAAAGHADEAIRAETGWFRGPDQQWRFEIPDQYSEYRPGRYVAKLREQGLAGNPYEVGFGGTVGDVMEHNKLYEAYPDLKGTPFYVDPELKAAGYHGMHGGRFGPESVALSPEIAPGMESGKSTLLHELQHEIQRREGFAPGGMIWKPDPAEVEALTARRQALEKKEAFDGLSRAEEIELEKAGRRLGQIQADMKTAPDVYRSLAGEVEARDVQARMNLSNSQRRAQAPYSSQGIPPEQMLVRGPEGGRDAGAAMALDMSPEARAARAAEMGYTVDAYHGTRSGFDQFAGRNRYGQAQPQYFSMADEPGAASYAASYAEGAGGRVMPVKLNMDKVLDARKPEDLAALRTVIDNDWQLGRDGADAFIERKFKDGLPGWGDDNLFRALDEAGYLGVVLRERPDLTSVAMWEPSNIRSRFAAFDPARANDPDLLASRAGLPVPAPQQAPEDPATAAARNAWVLEHIRRGGT